MRINTGIPLSCVWLPIASRFKIFLHSVMESERLIATIVVLFLLIIAIRRVQQVWFFTPYFFWKEDSTKVRLLSLPGDRLGKKNELLRLASFMDNMQTVKLSLDQKFTVHLETSSDSGALKWNEKKRKREEGFKCAVNMYKSLDNIGTQFRVKKNQSYLYDCVFTIINYGIN